MKIDSIKGQLELLSLELERQSMSKERLMEIKQVTRDMAHRMDAQFAVCSIAGMVEDIYRTETKYPKRRVKKVVRMLSEYFKG